MALINLDKNNFKQEVYQEKTPILIWFYQLGSDYCQMMRPLLDQLANDYEGKLNIGRVDMDREKALVYLFNIEASPSYILFKNCEIARTGIGELSIESLIELIES